MNLSGFGQRRATHEAIHPHKPVRLGRVLFDLESEAPCDLSLSVGHLDNILLHAVGRSAQLVEMRLDEDPVVILNDGEYAGQLSLEEARAVALRVELLAGIWRGQAHIPGHGKLYVSIDGKPMIWDVVSDHLILRLSLPTA